MLTKFLSVYQDCDLLFYLQGISNSVGNLSYFTNQLVNLLFRSFSGDDLANYTSMAVAIAGGDKNAAGDAFGLFLQQFFMRDIQQISSVPAYVQVDQIQSVI